MQNSPLVLFSISILLISKMSVVLLATNVTSCLLFSLLHLLLSSIEVSTSNVLKINVYNFTRVLAQLAERVVLSRYKAACLCVNQGGINHRELKFCMSKPTDKPTSHPRPTQPSIPPGSVNEYSFGWKGKRRYVSFR